MSVYTDKVRLRWEFTKMKKKIPAIRGADRLYFGSIKKQNRPEQNSQSPLEKSAMGAGELATPRTERR